MGYMECQALVVFFLLPCRAVYVIALQCRIHLILRNGRSPTYPLQIDSLVLCSFHVCCPLPVIPTDGNFHSPVCTPGHAF